MVMRWLSGLLIAFVSAATANACPFCSAVSQTFSEEMASMDAVVIAKLITLPEKQDPASNQPLLKAAFEIQEILKGENHVGSNKKLKVVFYGKAKPGDLFLIEGVDPPRLIWSTPLLLSARSATFMRRLPTLPKEGPERLAFFWSHLEDKEDLLARDAYDEFARAPYDVVKALKKQMDRNQLVNWIDNPDIPASRRRLYFTLLGVCGSNKDNVLLERLLNSSDKKDKAGLDALAACYLTLNGAAGLPLLEKLYLKNTESEYAETYSIIQAIRFHGTSEQIIPRPRLVESLRHVLERPPVADLVIPDLARWEDWSQIDRLTRLFKEADEKTSWVRVPIVNYLRACPLPAAKTSLVELEKIDPGAVRRAKTFFPFTNNNKANN